MICPAVSYQFKGHLKYEVILPVRTDDFAWGHILAVLPLSDQVFISGSAATWLAERAIFGSDPEWSPSDVDVFICHNQSTFISIAQTVLQRHSNKLTVINVHNIHNLFNIKVGSGPHLSFIKCRASLCAHDVVNQFDINICQPVVVISHDQFIVKMSPHVAYCIRNRLMECEIKKNDKRFADYPLSRTLHRLSKYRSRGYSLMSLTFLSNVHVDYPDCSQELQPEDFRPMLIDHNLNPRDKRYMTLQNIPSHRDATCKPD
jgi:hypothetical protein